jgi:hypothetical protein
MKFFYPEVFDLTAMKNSDRSNHQFKFIGLSAGTESSNARPPGAVSRRQIDGD